MTDRLRMREPLGEKVGANLVFALPCRGTRPIGGEHKVRPYTASSFGVLRATACAVALALLLVASTAQAAQVVEQEFPGKRKGLVMDSQFLRVGVIPAIGGRVVELIPKATGHNLLRTAPWYFHLGPNDPWEGAEYGGICDVATDGWPGPFWGVEYKVEKLDLKDALGLRLSAQAEGIGIERLLLIPDNSTVLAVKVKQTNLTGQPQKMVVRLHNELRVGTKADENDVIFWRDGAELKSRRCIPGSESPRFCFDTVTEDWAAIVDTVEKEALVHRFVRPGPPHRVFFWSGHNQPPPGAKESTGDHGFYNNERFCPKVEVAPDQSIELVEEFWVVQGLARVDLCTEQGVGSVELPRERFGRGEAIPVTCAFGSPVEQEGVEVEVAIGNATQRGKLARSAAGRASSVTLTIEGKGLADGKHSVAVTFSRAGAVIGRATRAIEVAGQLVAGARRAVAELEGKVAELRGQWRAGPVDAVRGKVLQARVDALKPFLEAGAFEEVLDASAKVDAAIQRAVEERARALAPKKPPVDDAGAVLERYRKG